QLVSREWALGASYRVTQSELTTTFTDIPQAAFAGAQVRDRAVLHEVGLSVNWNSPRGFFARVEGNFYAQQLGDDPRGLGAGAPRRDGDSFWQCNAFLGYRFNRNMNELSIGILNLTDQDYQLSPLSPYFDIARERMVVIRFRMGF
ncbi:MAG TPA: hypothetical protein VGE39_18455, partial [Prosthecobacter sp.]